MQKWEKIILWIMCQENFSLHEETSGKGIFLGHLATMYHPVIKSTCFQHKNVQRGTWKAPGDRINQADQESSSPDNPPT